MFCGQGAADGGAAGSLMHLLLLGLIQAQGGAAGSLALIVTDQGMCRYNIANGVTTVFACFGLAWCHHLMQLTLDWLCMVSPSDGACSRLFVSSAWGNRVDAVYSVWLCMVPPLDGWPLFNVTWCHQCDEAVLFECAWPQLHQSCHLLAFQSGLA
jgi:hypothetical protein